MVGRTARCVAVLRPEVLNFHFMDLAGSPDLDRGRAGLDDGDVGTVAPGS